MTSERADRAGLSALGTQHVRDPAVISAAIDAGVRIVDTADVYGTEAMIGALRLGDDVEIVTKGGLVVGEGGWYADGRAKHLDTAARASRERLGRIDLYLLHAVDPRVELAVSVRALAKVRDAGVATAIGLSNVTVTQLEAAMNIAPIEAVQIEVSPWNSGALRDGTVAAMRRLGVRVLAYKPFGGAAGAKRIAKAGLRFEDMLAWLRAHGVTPLPGATRIETARACAKQVELETATISELDARFLGQPAAAATEREVVVICGSPGSGKSTLAIDYVDRGYARLNRDDRGGTLKQLAQELDRVLAGGATRVVLDNTYPTRSSRAQVIAVARRHGARVKCIVVDVSIERAQLQTAARELSGNGNDVVPSVLFRFRRQWEPPRDDEGFASIETITPAPKPLGGTKPGLIVELDHVVWRGRPQRADDVALVEGITERLARWHDHVIVATTWQPGLDDATFAALVTRLRELLQLDLPAARCAHPAGPPVCWCRKPLPGMGLVLARAHDLDLARTVHAGSQPADRGFADRLGVRYEDWSAAK